MAKLKASPYISRLETKSTHGWQVRLPKWHPDGPATKFFSDGTYGSKANSKRAAELHRDRSFARHKLGFYALGRTRPKRFSWPEAPGLTFCLDARTEGRLRGAWGVFWSDEQGQHRRSKSVHKRKFSEALRLAVELREKQTGVPIQDEALLNTALLAVLRMKSFGLTPNEEG